MVLIKTDQHAYDLCFELVETTGGIQPADLDVQINCPVSPGKR